MPTFTPGPWSPPPTPRLAGVYRSNEALAAATLWPVGGTGPEDVVVAPDGRVYTGLDDGRIQELSPDGTEVRTIADTGGRPLGIELHPSGGLVICDAERGLLWLHADGHLEPLVTEVDGERLVVTNNASVAADGTIYFTESSRRWPFSRYTTDILEQSATGRLLALDPDGTVRTVLDGLAFANGVAVVDGHVLVAELARYRIHRVSIASGAAEIWVENLPGFPDNLTAHDGLVWVAMPRPRDRFLDRLIPRPRLRAFVNRLPDALQPKPGRHGMVLALDAVDGSVVHNLQDASGRVAATTTARMSGDRLFVGSLSEPTIAVLSVPGGGADR